MNRALSFAATLMIAAPLFAADPKPVSNPTQQPPAQADSPLVAAAKRTNRLGKKPGYVITNDNLVTTGGHFTTTAQQVPLTTPLPSSNAAVNPQLQQQQQAAAAAEQAKQKKAEEDRRRLKGETRAQHEDDLYENEDPAALEHRMQQMQTKQPDQMQKPSQDQTQKKQ
ncbi:MAG TPA: hypothetical protein VII75_09005 [Thermoanaerobaculia bacterium]|nr:hypothetical protein [Thermoanaerobaculia bacterium]